VIWFLTTLEEWRRIKKLRILLSILFIALGAYSIARYLITDRWLWDAVQGILFILYALILVSGRTYKMAWALTWIMNGLVVTTGFFAGGSHDPFAIAIGPMMVIMGLLILKLSNIGEPAE
jgi:hypothetical protein